MLRLTSERTSSYGWISKWVSFYRVFFFYLITGLDYFSLNYYAIRGSIWTIDGCFIEQDSIRCNQCKVEILFT